jgi:FAD/FMN-containing dehydrogenase
VVKNVAGFDITRLTVGSWGSLGVVTAVSARLFPLPEADLTLLLLGPSAEQLLPIAQFMARSSVPLAAVELLDPIRPPLPGKGAGEAEGERAGLALRFLASEVQAREVEDRLLKELTSEAVDPGGSVRSLWGAESAAFHQALESWEEGAELVIRMSLLPSRMDTLLSSAGRLAEEGFQRPRVSGHVGSGVVRLSFSDLPGKEEGLSELAGRLRSLRDRLTNEGGGLVVSHAPRNLHQMLGPPGLDDDEARLIRGLRAEFDPAGILSPGRPVGRHP